MENIIIDTDIGSDVDDLLALALALSFSEIQLKAITLVSGDVAKRACVASLLLEVTKQTHIPLALGREVPIPGIPPYYRSWMTFEGHGFNISQANCTPLPISASRLILDTIRSSQQDISLIAIGPLSNVAEAISDDRETMSKVRQLVIMGGAIQSYNQPPDNRVEYNIGADVQAAQVVFGAALPLVVVPLNVTEQVFLDRQGLEEIRSLNTPISDFIYSAVNHYLTTHNKTIKHLHDPLTISLMDNLSFVHTLPMKLALHSDGRFVAYPPDAQVDGSLCKVAVSLNAAAFMRFFVSQMLALSRNSLTA